MARLKDIKADQFPDLSGLLRMLQTLDQHKSTTTNDTEPLSISDATDEDTCEKFVGSMVGNQKEEHCDPLQFDGTCFDTPVMRQPQRTSRKTQESTKDAPAEHATFEISTTLVSKLLGTEATLDDRRSPKRSVERVAKHRLPAPTASATDSEEDDHDGDESLGSLDDFNGDDDESLGSLKDFIVDDDCEDDDESSSSSVQSDGCSLSPTLDDSDVSIIRSLIVSAPERRRLVRGIRKVPPRPHTPNSGPSSCIRSSSPDIVSLVSLEELHQRMSESGRHSLLAIDITAEGCETSDSCDDEYAPKDISISHESYWGRAFPTASSKISIAEHADPKPPARPVSIPSFPYGLDGHESWSSGLINDRSHHPVPRRWATPPEASSEVLLPPSKTEIGASPSKNIQPQSTAKLRLTDFHAKKVGLAESYLRELDQKITGGQIAELAASSGGVEISWSKSLRTTGGRARWTPKKTHQMGHMRVTEQPQSSALSSAAERRTGAQIGNEWQPPTAAGYSEAKDNLQGPSSKLEHLWKPKIELSLKVVDDEDRLRSVLAHEFCHLTTGMIDQIRDPPHGRVFKSWARKAEAAFPEDKLSIKTYHSFAITYKYIWHCKNDACSSQMKRHSKSVDVAKVRCRQCRSRFIQVQPKPRPRTDNLKDQFHTYLGSNHARLKAANPGLTFGELSKLAAEEYRRQKERETEEIGAMSQKLMTAHLEE